MALNVIPVLIDKQDTFEAVRDQIALILATESANQQALAIAATKDPDLWKLNIFTEASNPWNRFTNIDSSSDLTPLVNVWYDTGSFPGTKGDTVERQAHEATYNVDCYGVAISATDGGTGQLPGDSAAAVEVQRTVKLVRNILMAAQNVYLQLQGTVWQRWIQSITVFQPQLDDQSAQHIVGARVALRVTFNEFAPQYATEVLEYLAVDITRSADGFVLAETDFDYTL